MFHGTQKSSFKHGHDTKYVYFCEWKTKFYPKMNCIILFWYAHDLESLHEPANFYNE